MIDTKHAPQTLYLFECRGKDKHRIYRDSSNYQGRCSRCENAFNVLGAFPRGEGENEIQHRIRTLSYKPQRVN